MAATASCGTESQSVSAESVEAPVTGPTPVDAALAGADSALALGQHLVYTIGSIGTGDVIYQARTDWTETGLGAYTALRQVASNNGSAAVIDNSGWGDMMMDDVNGDGQQEVIARKLAGTSDPDQLYTFSNTQSAFSLATNGTPVGNSVLRGRDAAADGAATVFYTNFESMPDEGTVRSMRIHSQGSATTFHMLQLRPTGNPDEYTIVYDSGTITAPTGPVGTAVSIAFPGGATQVEAGDVFAHYGQGIPYSPYNGNNSGNAPPIFYSVSLADATNLGSTIKLDGSDGHFPMRLDLSRDYAWAVNFEHPSLTYTDATPAYPAGTFYRAIQTGVQTAVLNDVEIWNYDTGTPSGSGQQYPWYDLSSALSGQFPWNEELVSATLNLSGQVSGNSSPGSVRLGVFVVPDDNKGIDSIYTDLVGDNIAEYYAAHLADVIDEVTVSASSGVFNAEWDVTSLMAQWLANSSDPLAGQIVILSSAPLQLRWSRPGPTLMVVTRVPEPGTFLLLGLGAVGLLGLRRRKRARRRR